LAGKNHINEADIENIEYLETDEDGWGIYKFKFQPGTDPISSFDDIENHWAKSNIEAMAAANVLEGYPNGKFLPEGAVTRAEFSKMIVRALDLDLVQYNDQFTDVDKNDWYADYVATMVSKAYVQGYPE